MTAHLDQMTQPRRPSLSDEALPHGPSRGLARPWHRQPERGPTAVIALAMFLPALLGLVAGGSGRSSPPVASGRLTRTAPPAVGSSGHSVSPSPGSPVQQALAFARCMRRHGVPDFPDPNSNGGFPPAAKQISLRNPQVFQEARTACDHLLPNGGNGPTPAQWQQILGTMVNFAHCMRRHGAPNWPDPTVDTHGRPVFDINVDPNSTPFMGEIRACKYLLVNYGSRPGWPDLSNYFQQSQG